MKLINLDTIRRQNSFYFVGGRFCRSLEPDLAHLKKLWDCPGVIRCENPLAIGQNVTQLIAFSTDDSIREDIRNYAQGFVNFSGLAYKDRLPVVTNRLIDNYSKIENRT